MNKCCLWWNFRSLWGLYGSMQRESFMKMALIGIESSSYRSRNHRFEVLPFSCPYNHCLINFKVFNHCAGRGYYKDLLHVICPSLRLQSDVKLFLILNVWIYTHTSFGSCVAQIVQGHGNSIVKHFMGFLLLVFLKGGGGPGETCSTSMLHHYFYYYLQGSHCSIVLFENSLYVPSLAMDVSHGCGI